MTTIIDNSDNTVTKLEEVEITGDTFQFSGRLLRDIYYMKMFNHPNIVKLINPINEMSIQPGNKSQPNDRSQVFPQKTFSKRKQVIGYNIRKYDGTILDYVDMIRQNKNLRKQILYQILNGLDHIHKSNLIHNNINPTNVLLYGTSVKLSDFRFMFNNSSATSNNNLLAMNKSPEVLLKLESDNKVDIWAVGCIMYFILTGEPLMITEKNIYDFSVKDSLDKLSINNIDKYELDLLVNLLLVDKDLRFSTSEAILHEYFYDIYNFIMLGDLLAYNINPYVIYKFIDNTNLDYYNKQKFKVDNYNLLLHSSSLTNLTIKLDEDKLFDNIRLILKLDMVDDRLLFQIIYCYIHYISKCRFTNNLLDKPHVITSCINYVKCLNYSNGLSIETNDSSNNNKYLKIYKVIECTYDISSKLNKVVSPFDFLYIYKEIMDMSNDIYKLATIICKCCLFDIDLLCECPKLISYCSLYISNLILRDCDYSSLFNYIHDSSDFWVNLELLIQDITIDNPYILISASSNNSSSSDNNSISRDILFKILNSYRLNKKYFV